MFRDWFLACSTDQIVRQHNDLHNYKDLPKGKSLTEWIRHPRVIISVEQVAKLGQWVDLYRHGVLVMDECVTTASSIVNGVTVDHSHAEVAGYIEPGGSPLSSEGHGGSGAPLEIGQPRGSGVRCASCGRAGGTPHWASTAIAQSSSIDAIGTGWQGGRQATN